MADIVINYDDVTNMANTLGTAGDVIETLDVVFTALAAVLIATGFGAPIGAKYLSNYKSKVIDLYNKCRELDGDLKQAVVAIQNGDQEGANRFTGF